MIHPAPSNGCHLCGLVAPLEEPGDHLRDLGGGREGRRQSARLKRVPDPGTRERGRALACVDVVACVRRQHRQLARRRGLAA